MRQWMAALCLLLAAVAPANAAKLIIHVEHVSPKGGVVSLALFTASNYSDDAHPTASRDVAAKAPETTIVIDGLAPGTYAIKTFQDIARTGKFETDTLGLPLEPFGFSNDALPIIGEPGFDRTSFYVGSGETEITIHLSGTDAIRSKPAKSSG